MLRRAVCCSSVPLMHTESDRGNVSLAAVSFGPHIRQSWLPFPCNCSNSREQALALITATSWFEAAFMRIFWNWSMFT